MSAHQPDRTAAIGQAIQGSIVECFEEQVRRHPQNVAIREPQCDMTYEALNQFVNRLARLIDGEACVRSPHVALLYDQGSWLAIAGMLAALKAGRTYVPLDPEYPAAHTSYMLQHSQAGLILCSAKHTARAVELGGTDVRAIVGESVDSSLPDGNLGKEIPHDTPAYILYTSGSTGRPKGVIQTHRNLLHFISSYAGQLQISTDDRLTLFYSYSFSASLMDIYGALLHGATVLPYNLNEHGIGGLPDWLVRERITIYHSVPTVFRTFVESLTPGVQLPTVRAIDLGGEPVYKHDVELFKRHFSPACVLVNHLAFTEASVSAQYPITPDTEIAGSVAPVGFDAKGVKLRLIDEHNAEAPPGQIGEIVVESEFLSPGYWRDEELTQAAFGSFTEEGAARCYRTGDLGRRLTCGMLEHLGRKDSRVKIRGHSVEVAEVEEALLRVEGIRAAVVAARPDHRGNMRLAAYYVCSEDQAPTAATLRARLLHTLPDYMTPAAFLPLQSLPLTVTGKVDRQALPTPTWSERSLETPFVAPQSAHEKILAEILARVLGLAQVGIEDDFFELGGDSLLALHLLLEVRNTLGAELQPSILAEAPTIQRLAQVLGEASQDRPRASPVVALQPKGTRSAFFLVPPAGQTVLIFRDLARHGDADQPLYALSHRGMENSEAPHESVEEMASYFLRAIREIQPRGPYLIGGLCFGATIAFEMARQLQAAGEGIGLLIVLDEMPPGFQRTGRGLTPSLHRFGRRFWFHLWNNSLYRNVHRRLKRMRRMQLTQHVDQVWRAHRRARASYRPQRIDVEIALFVTSEWQDDTDWLNQWRSLTTREPQIFQVPGRHGRNSDSFIVEPHVSSWADALSDCLRKAPVGELSGMSVRPAR